MIVTSGISDSRHDQEKCLWRPRQRSAVINPDDLAASRWPTVPVSGQPPRAAGLVWLVTRLFVSVPYVVAAMMVVSAYKQLGPPGAFGEPPLVKAESGAIKSSPASISGALLVNDDIFGEEERAEDVSWKSYVHAPPTTSNGAKLTVADRLTGLVETDPRVGPLEAKLTMEANSSSQAIALSEVSPPGITPMRSEPTMAAFATSGTRQAKLDLGATEIQDQTVEREDLHRQIQRKAAEADAWLARLQAQGQDL